MWFVAQLGTLAVGACGAAFSIMEFISSMGYLFGMGGGTCIGMPLGGRKPKEAGVIGSTAFFFALALGVVVTLLGLAFIEPLKSTLLASLPQGIYYIPAIFLLPLLLGADGVILAPLAGQALSAVTTVPFIRWYFEKMRREERGEE